MDSNVKIYDLIIVYSEDNAKSAKDKSYRGKVPFFGECKIYNDSYNYFLLRCKKMGIRAALATSKDIIGPGLFQSFWTYDKKWIRNAGKAHSRILFDKFTPTTIEQRGKLKLLTPSKFIYTFNNKKLVDIFQNKLYTYKYFKEFAIPSVKINNPSKEEIYLAKTKLDKLLKRHKYRNDFKGYLIKDRCGSGGSRIFKVDLDCRLKDSLKEIEKQHKLDMKNGRLVSYILQPFINYDKGFVFGKYKGFIDLRVILLNHKIVQTYIRIARKGDFRCNEHQGGNLVYMPKKIILKDVLVMTQKIIKKLKLKLKQSLYALDFIRSNNGNLYFVEGNIKPGIDWNHKKKINEIRSKELINLIVDELKSIIKTDQTSYRRATTEQVSHEEHLKLFQ
jgi:glutathione synthase/RimK-type ligase-like ATP-grasp enzyme